MTAGIVANPTDEVIAMKRLDAFLFRTVATALTATLLTTLLAAQDPQPAVRIEGSPAAKPAASSTDEKQVYDEAADATKVVAAAIAKAKKENQRVLIQWGANWCGWCKWLAATMKSDAKLSREILYEYQVVHVDVGRFDKHMDLAKSVGAEFKAIPFLTILDGDGKPVVQQNTEPFETDVDGKQGHDAKKVLAFLKEHEAKPLTAASVLADAVAAAKKDGKRVFLHFGAPWCGWCHRLEDWMARPEIAAVLAKDFVDLKIDNDRMTGGKEVYEQQLAAAGQKAGGIPWFVFLDADGKLLAHSTAPAPTNNVGFPHKAEEVAHFVAMLKKSLDEIRESDEAKKKARDAATPPAQPAPAPPAKTGPV